MLMCQAATRVAMVQTTWLPGSIEPDLARGSRAEGTILQEIADLGQQDFLIGRWSRSRRSLCLLLAQAVNALNHQKDRESHNHKIHYCLQEGTIVQRNGSGGADGFLQGEFQAC